MNVDALVSAIVWEDPPDNHATYGRRKWEGLLTPLMARPTVWARLETCASANTAGNRVNSLNRRRVEVPPGRWEFASRRLGEVGSKEWGVYARYLGPEDES